MEIQGWWAFQKNVSIMLEHSQAYGNGAMYFSRQTGKESVKKKINKKIINTCCLASGCYLIWFQGRAQPGQDARAVPELCVCFQQQLCCLLRLEKASRWPLGVQKHITEYADKDERCQEVGNQVWKVPRHWYVGRRTELTPSCRFFGHILLPLPIAVPRMDPSTFPLAHFQCLCLKLEALSSKLPYREPGTAHCEKKHGMTIRNICAHLKAISSYQREMMWQARKWQFKVFSDTLKKKRK